VKVRIIFGALRRLRKALNDEKDAYQMSTIRESKERENFGDIVIFEYFSS